MLWTLLFALLYVRGGHKLLALLVLGGRLSEFPAFFSDADASCLRHFYGLAALVWI